jgi:hypothetical protein
MATKTKNDLVEENAILRDALGQVYDTAADSGIRPHSALSKIQNVVGETLGVDEDDEDEDDGSDDDDDSDGDFEDDDDDELAEG